MELTHASVQSFMFPRKLAGADLQFLHRWAVASHWTIVREDIANARSYDSAEQVRLAANLPEAISSAELQ